MVMMFDHASRRKMPRNGQGNLANEYSGKWSPDFEGEFIQTLPVNRLSIFDGFRPIPRYFFRRLRTNV